MRMTPLDRAFARALRQTATSSEIEAWELLRKRRCHGLKFRRQHFIAGYFVDFFCCAYAMVVEIDGACHNGDQAFVRGIHRAEALRRAGVRYQIHVRPHEVQNLPAIVHKALTHSAAPLSR